MQICEMYPSESGVLSASRSSADPHGGKFRTIPCQNDVAFGMTVTRKRPFTEQHQKWQNKPNLPKNWNNNRLLGATCHIQNINRVRDSRSKSQCRRNSSEMLSKPLWYYSLMFCFLILPFHIATIHAFPLNRKSVSNNDMAGAVTFLTKFGYLPASDIETGNLRTEAQLSEAIKVMQRFGSIPETGELDERTLQLMKRKRCGNPDDPHKEYLSDRTKRYALQGVKWPKVDLTWSLNEITTSLSKESIRYELGQAFKFWSDASKLTFSEVQAEDNADIKVSFYSRYHGDGYPFDGQGAILAHAFFPGDGRGGDTHFDKEEHWIAGIENSNDGVSLLSVAAHEFGHSLGLAHSSVPDALMFPYYQGLKNNFQLPYDDTMGIQQLYGGKEDRPWAPLPPTATRPPYAAPPTTSTRATPPTTTPRRPPKKVPLPPTKAVIVDKPDTCDTDYDAISVIRHEIFIFKNKYFWRLDDTRNLDMNYPVEIERFWYNLPADLKHVDALYERLDKKIVFFIGQQYWIFDANHPLPGYPKPLSHLGLPEDIKKLDAAMVWGHNKKTYFFSGTMYWKFDEERQLVELDYPRDISNVWVGVPYDIDAAFQSSSGDTYFFKGKAFWKFNDVRMRVENKAPSLSGPFWMGCPDRTVYASAPQEDREEVGATNKYTEVMPVKGASGVPRPAVALLGLFLLLVSLL